MTVSTERLTGSVKRLLRDKGYGFLTGPNGDVFMHRSAGDPDVFDVLEVGESVTYYEDSNPKGLRARDVQPAVTRVYK